MKIKVPHGVGTTLEIDVADGATAELILGHADVVTVCGAQNAVRVNQAEVPLNTPLKDGDVVEPVQAANEKATC